MDINHSLCQILIDNLLGIEQGRRYTQKELLAREHMHNDGSEETKSLLYDTNKRIWKLT